MNSLRPLTVLTLLPAFGAVLTLLVGARQKRAARATAMGCAVVALAVAGWLWTQFVPAAGMQLEERWSWIPSLGIEYHLGVDGLGLLMVLLAALIIPFAMIASWKVEQNRSLYFSLLLFLESGLFGTFTALNFFHWFIFWELSLIPAFFLIKLWGGPARTGAAYQFFVYTMAGSVGLLLSFLALYSASGTFDFLELAGRGATLFKGHENTATLVFLGVFLGFAVKVPLIPFHTWLPGAYAEAPTGTSMVLTGAMSKMGVYGFLRILLPIFPEQTRAMLTPLLWLAVATIVFSAAAAFVQKDLKRMVAYSSINHLGYCLLGIFAAAQLTDSGAAWSNEKAAALNGVILQMFNHGLTAAALFYFVGLIEERSGGLRGVADFGGLRKAAPVFCGLMGITLFASLGLPGLNGFVGEFLIFKGVFPLASWAAALSVLGLLFTAIFLLTILQKVFTGPTQARWDGWTDLTLGERWTAGPVIALMFIIGICPQLLLGIANPTVVQMVQQISTTTPAPSLADGTQQQRGWLEKDGGCMRGGGINRSTLESSDALRLVPRPYTAAVRGEWLLAPAGLSSRPFGTWDTAAFPGAKAPGNYRIVPSGHLDFGPVSSDFGPRSSFGFRISDFGLQLNAALPRTTS